MSNLRPGNDGDPLPRGTRIFRIGKETQLSPAALARGKALAEMFELSSEDKKARIPRLSVWVEELTIADQAWTFMGAKPANTVVACLCADDIRAIEPPPGFESLDVQWEQAMTDDGVGNQVPNRQPGVEGHTGIANLDQGGAGKQDRNKRKDLRSKLADKAEISPVPVPHDLPEDHIRVAAYFIYENTGRQAGQQAPHWVMAIRQLRRERVKQHNLKEK